ncbi:MAG: hypothetical protein IT285_04660 [Bdellovibrionales bacterium]|nr:hypothetical protein [Bdellovibrionales bacterium]
MGERAPDRRPHPLVLFFLLTAAVFGSACTQSGELDKRGKLDLVNRLLTEGDCAAAIEVIDPLYDSSDTDNEVRMLRASAYGCSAGINYFDLVEEFQTGNLVGNAFWEFSTRLFPSVSTDNILESSWFAFDAVQAAVEDGVAVPDSQKREISDDYNSGALRAVHRTPDSNQYMTMVAMAVMGATHNRHGSPSPLSYRKLADLPWIAGGVVNETGCAYAGAVVSFFDGIDEAADLFPASTAAQLQAASTQFSAAIDDACDRGCRGVDSLNNVVDAPCAFNDCGGVCPYPLLGRLTCATDPRARCAAAGLVRFVNDDAALGWLDGP